MPTTVFSDNFNIANTSALGANYSEVRGDASIVSNQVRVPPVGANPGILATTTTAHSALQDMATQVKRRVPGSTADGGPVVRYQGAETCYYADEYNGKLDLIKRVAGTDTTIQSNSNTQADNDVVRIEATGISPTTLKMFINGVQKGTTATDSQAGLQTTGQAAILCWNTGDDFDDLQVDNLAATTPTLPRIADFFPAFPRNEYIGL